MSRLIDFSSAFNTIKPEILIRKLIDIGVPSELCAVVLDFLTERVQRVFANNMFSDPIRTDTGAPQGCVLSAFLFIIYTNLLQSMYDDISIIKYADDTVIIGLIEN
jgi:hypothetical protein